METFNFDQEVLQKSHEKPVLVDFWAPWCGPCRVLGPVIEQIAEEQSGRWQLVKVNTEEEQELAERYQIRSIPNVKLFYKGEVVGEFMGALPKSAIEDWLVENLPDDRIEVFNRLLSAFQQEQTTDNLEALENFVNQNADLKAPAVVLGKMLVLTDPEKAIALVESIVMGDKLYDDAQDIRVLAALMNIEPAEAPAAQALQKAKAAIENDDLETALQAVIDATTVDKSYQDDLPRKTAIALFRLLGTQHELTKKYRWRFDMALY